MPQQSHGELGREGPGEARVVPQSAETPKAVRGKGDSGTASLMERVVSHSNLTTALKRVRENNGSPGIDGMTVEELQAFWDEREDDLREQLLRGTYRPPAVRRVQIPKDSGGTRELGIPTVTDRLIQQAILQVLQPLIDPTFSEHSYGFRPGRSAKGAVEAARAFVQKGKRYVVDMDLEQFFDRVNHDILMDRLAKRIPDKRVLRLIRRYLESGVMLDGVVVSRHEGTPQGGPLSPLLANVLLDEVDRHLEARGHTFVRYADDCNVYVGSRRAGLRVMAGLRRVYARLCLKVNETKSAVGSVAKRKILGYSMWFGPQGRVCLRVAEKALEKMKKRVRDVTTRKRGVSIKRIAEELRSYLTGWRNYFNRAETPGAFDEIDKWIRHRMRALHLKQWKRGRTMYAELMKRGCSQDRAAIIAGNARRWWRNSAMNLNGALPNAYFDRLGIPRLGR